MPRYEPKQASRLIASSAERVLFVSSVCFLRVAGSLGDPHVFQAALANQAHEAAKLPGLKLQDPLRELSLPHKVTDPRTLPRLHPNKAFLVDWQRTSEGSCLTRDRRRSEFKAHSKAVEGAAASCSGPVQRPNPCEAN